MRLISTILILGFAFVFSSAMYAQEESHNETEDEEFHHHSIALFLSHPFISQGIQDNDRDWLIAPSWAVNYNYNFNEKWALGWHNDIIIEEFVVEDSRAETEDLERSYPFSSLIAGTYKVSDHWDSQ